MSRFSTPSTIRNLLLEGMRRRHDRYEAMARGEQRVPCWEAPASIDLGADLVLRVYTPRNRTDHPVLAFTGTRVPSRIGDWTDVEQLRRLYADLEADAFVDGIGLFRYCFNEGAIKTLIESLNERFGRKVVLVGHSLGGALAQLAVCDHWRLVQQIVTFQSPGIPLFNLAKLLGAPVRDVALRSFHYHVRGDDFVPVSGEALTPGNHRVIALRGVTGNLEAHTSRIYERLSGRGAARLTTRQVAQWFEHIDAERRTLANPTRASNDLMRGVVEVIRRTWGAGPPLTTREIGWLQRRDEMPASVRPIAIVEPDRAGATLRLYRHVYVIVWEHIKAEVSGTPPPDDMAELRRLWDLSFDVPPAVGRVISLARSRNIFEWLTEGWGSAPRAREALPEDWCTHLRQGLQQLRPDLFPPARRFRRQERPPSDVHMDDDGHLTPAGFALLRRREPEETRALHDDTIQRIFTGDYTIVQPEVSRRVWERESRLQARWRELIVEADVIRHYDARPIGFDDEGRISDDNPVPGLLRGPEGNFLITGRTLATTFTYLTRLEDELRTAVDTEIQGENLREWSTVHYLRRFIHEPWSRDEDLTAAYLRAHVHFLTCAVNDPLDLVRPEPLRVHCCQDVPGEEWGLNGFRDRARRYGNARTGGSGGSQDRPGGARPGADDALGFGAYQWYTFLFSLDGRGSRFLGDTHERAEIRGCLRGRACDRVGAGMSMLRDKKPDIIQILPNRQFIEVLDASFRWDVPWHNFKTAFYASVLRQIFPGWSVRGIDYRRQGRSRLAG